MAARELLDRHNELTGELAAALRAVGDLRAGVVRAHSATWRETAHLPVTERRETCKDAVADIDFEIAKATGEIEALRAEVNHVEWLLRYLDG